jgi:hypothetical protein
MTGKAFTRWAACAALLLSPGCCWWAERHCATCHPPQAAGYYQTPAPVCCQPAPCCQPCQCAPGPANYQPPPPAAPAGTWNHPAGCCQQ